MAEESKSAGSLRASPIGEVLPISGHDARFGEDYEAEAFVPHDLPDHVDLPGPVWKVVSEAMTEQGQARRRREPDSEPTARIATRER
ncbi:MAG: hypothetical protein ACR2H3_09070 [Acidimicrobiales bacterium]